MDVLATLLAKCFGADEGSGDSLLWDVGLRPHALGDYSIAAVQANSTLEDQAQVFTSPSSIYIGVYDGHGGPQASRFISDHLFSSLHEFTMEYNGLTKDVIKKAFNATEEGFIRLVKKSYASHPQLATVGSCCLVGAISNGVLYVANLGDSRAVLGTKISGDTSTSSVVAERLSTDHNVSVEEVRKEVKALHPDDSHIVVFTRGVWRIKGIIQVSRSIGDLYLKRPDVLVDRSIQRCHSLPLKRPVVTAEPSMVVRTLRPHDLFLIFASDGFWEHLTDEMAVDLVAKSQRQGVAKRLVIAALKVAAAKLRMQYNDIKTIEKGLRRCFHDDISVVVMYLDRPGNSDRSFRSCSSVDCIGVPPDIFSINSDQARQSPLYP